MVYLYNLFHLRLFLHDYAFSIIGRLNEQIASTVGKVLDSYMYNLIRILLNKQGCTIDNEFAAR